MFRLLPVGFALSACTNETNTSALRRVLTTEQATFDAGVVAVNDRQTTTVYLESTGPAPVTVFDVHFEEEDPAWVLLDTWTNDTTTLEDGSEAEVLTMEQGSDDDPTIAPVEVSFRPSTEGDYRTTLVIESNDTEVLEQDPDSGHSLWKVVLRGVARYPCANVYPAFFDFGSHPAGSFWTEEATIENCGSVTLTASTFQLTGDEAFSTDSVFPIPVLAGGIGSVQLSWTVGSSDAQEATLSLVTNDPNYDDAIDLIGNDCENSADGSWDADGDGWYSCGGDCDDDDPDINPEAVDGKDDAADGVDNDCDGSKDEGAGLGVDNDGDGYTENDGDCWDNKSAVHPDASESANQIDDDCDGKIDEATSIYDDDKDGFSEREGDCDDRDSGIYPGASEAYDTIDNDCDGNIDEGTYSFDDDEDGYAELNADGSTGDCDDTNSWVYPDATEDCDGVDNDCDGDIDEGSLDEENGACDFVVERDTTETPPVACATGGARSGALGLLAALGLVAARRRRRDQAR